MWMCPERAMEEELNEEAFSFQGKRRALPVQTLLTQATRSTMRDISESI